MQRKTREFKENQDFAHRMNYATPTRRGAAVPPGPQKPRRRAASLPVPARASDLRRRPPRGEEKEGAENRQIDEGRREQSSEQHIVPSPGAEMVLDKALRPGQRLRRDRVDRSPGRCRRPLAPGDPTSAVDDSRCEGAGENNETDEPRQKPHGCRRFAGARGRRLSKQRGRCCPRGPGRPSSLRPLFARCYAARSRPYHQRDRRGGRAAEGARLESVYAGNRIAGSNPAPSAR